MSSPEGEDTPTLTDMLDARQNRRDWWVTLLLLVLGGLVVVSCVVAAVLAGIEFVERGS